MNARLLILLPASLITAPALAQGGDSPLDPLFTCRDIADDGARLACLDAAVDALRSETESGEVVAVDREQIEAAEEATYGLTIPQFRLPGLSLPGGGEDAELAELESASASPQRVIVRDTNGQIESIEGLAVAEISENRSGDTIVRLANGQVWRQTDNTYVQLTRSRADTDYTATISNGALGSHFMRLDNGGRRFRVERVE
ncbi:hypothetical protein AWH62_10965 [Maricaulis sp. W15]|uniref:hypothetical protein n=1 Tax=Maricaulis sp. W15 TaxID=1772333 RepID=UPI000948F24C|nr:hypothetical protein [Maricaulis sp. W15]OLF72344.1 hypothetical protein AWH62_10965 [Maricaulis sp. W15]